MQTTSPILARRIEPRSDGLLVELADRSVLVPWGRASERLAEARPEERMQAELSPSGYGVHWPLLDEDITVAGLLRQEASS